MSHEEYEASKKLDGASFYALIMAAMRQADTANLKRLQAAWPRVWTELQERYNLPGGWYPKEQHGQR